MASNTTNLNLYKKDPIADKDQTFNITTMMNENWDKIDQNAGQTATQLAQIEIDVTDLINNKSIHSSGENANGIWIRFQDGTQICTHRLTVSATANTAANQDWMYPADFISPINTRVVFSLISVSVQEMFTFSIFPSIAPIWESPTSQTRRLTFTASITQTYTFDLVAIGRWK